MDKCELSGCTKQGDFMTPIKEVGVFYLCEQHHKEEWARWETNA